MGFLVTIDNGGTLTDICASGDDVTVHAKTLTTPHDLTECFIKSLEVLSEKVYGATDLARMIAAIDTIRYSTTQGTNAIVQRKGPSIGWLVDDVAVIEAVAASAPELYAAFVGTRVQVVALDANADADAQRKVLTTAMAKLVSDGANRVVVGFAGPQAAALEKLAKRVLYRSFPRHLLGAVPMLFATELAPTGSAERRIWAALLNAFLHPTMDQFLYNAENKLRLHRARKPLLIFRNDGNSTRVAKTVAIKTYSSGPQGGVVGGEVLLAHYALKSAVSIDIGGTTTDIAVFNEGLVARHESGDIEGAPVPIPLTAIQSIGAGGSSIIRAENGRVIVGPESVGSTPGPACFGRGGKQATMTDAFLVEGVLDPKSYFGGQLELDVERARAAVMSNVGTPLGLDLQAAVEAMFDAYDQKIADALDALEADGPARVLMAFGGAGPMSACGIAEKAGIGQILIPRYAAVFCAYGIGFSDIQHDHRVELGSGGAAEYARARSELGEQARRGMLAEGFDLEGCTLDYSLLKKNGVGYLRTATEQAGAQAGDLLELKVTRPIAKTRLAGKRVDKRRKATPAGIRKGYRELPLYTLETLQPGDWADGPCLVEEAFFTAVIKPDWRFVISDGGDVFVTKLGA